MKRTLSLILCAIMCVLCVASFAGCGGSKATDWQYIADKGNLVIGITYYQPMNYLDDAGELQGFETEFAKAVCEKLGVTPKFQVINWTAKETELNAKNIDCIWNGMTIDEDRLKTMDISTPYMANKQVLVTKAENAEKYNSADALEGLTVVAEKESAGESVATENEFFAKAKYTAVDTQAKALMEVFSGTADACVIDYVTSRGMIGEDTDYSTLSVVENANFAKEEYGIAFRKDSPVTLEKINATIQELANDGTLDKIAEKYDLAEQLLVKPASAE